MSELRDNLGRAKRAHQALRYPGNLAADVGQMILAPARAMPAIKPVRRNAWRWVLLGTGVAGTGIAATLALIVVIVVGAAHKRSQRLAMINSQAPQPLPAISLSGLPPLSLPSASFAQPARVSRDDTETNLFVGLPSLHDLPSISPDVPYTPISDSTQEPSS